MPEAVLAAMTALRACVEPPPPTPILEEALDPGERGLGDGHSENDMMDELDGVDEDDEAELAAIALRLKRARRS